MNDLSNKIVALLFALGRPLSKKELTEKLKASSDDIAQALSDLRAQKGGVVVVDDGSQVELRIAGEYAPLIEEVRKEEYAREVGRAGMETLAAILYRGPLTRSEIDFIRGVNSSQTLRTLTMRGLVRKIPNPRDERSFLYEPTTELMSQLGISAAAELPDFADVKAKLQTLEEAYKAKESEN